MSFDRLFSTGTLAVIAVLVWGGVAWLSMTDRPRQAETASRPPAERSIATDAGPPASPPAPVGPAQAAEKAPAAFSPGLPEPAKAEQFRADTVDRPPPGETREQSSARPPAGPAGKAAHRPRRHHHRPYRRGER